MSTELIGYLAAILTTFAFVPRAVQAWRTRDTAGISLRKYAFFCTSVALWLVYGLLLGAWPIIIANAITLALSLTILALKLRYG